MYHSYTTVNKIIYCNKSKQEIIIFIYTLCKQELHLQSLSFEN